MRVAPVVSVSSVALGLCESIVAKMPSDEGKIKVPSSNGHRYMRGHLDREHRNFRVLSEQRFTIAEVEGAEEDLEEQIIEYKRKREHKKKRSKTSKGSKGRSKSNKSTTTTTTTLPPPDRTTTTSLTHTPEELRLSTWSWGAKNDMLIFEGIEENQVIWDVAFASRKMSTEGKCFSKDVSGPIGTNSSQSFDLEEFLNSCSLESVHLHVTVPRTVQGICFGSAENCRPVLCSLSGDQEKIDLNDVSKLSYAPGNNQLLFGLSKNCEIRKPFYWDDYVDLVIGNNTRLEWSNDELYRMDLDGDGLTNIIEYYGLRLGDMYVDIAYGGHPPVSNPDWPYRFPSTATDPYSVDTDGDLLTDAYELLYGLDPREPNDIFADTDGEGLTDFQEQIYGTNPFVNDTDGDSVNDYKETEDGTNPLDDSDFELTSSQGNLRRRLENSHTIPITLTVGDHSSSHSERYAIRVGDIEHAATEFGVVSSGVYSFRAGVYPITVRHIDSKLDTPDYDYTASVSGPGAPDFDHFDVSVDDPDDILGSFGDSYWDRTVGKIATLRIKRQSDTPDDCACRKCEVWANEERAKGLDWINNLPQCPCNVVENTVSSAAASIGSIFGVWVTRESTKLYPIGETDTVWKNDLMCNPNGDCSGYHPGAYGCLRAPAKSGPHGQQCCYDHDRSYIPAGSKAAGTPDYQEGTLTNWYDHRVADVIPYAWCCTECEIESTCDLYIGNDAQLPGVRADIRGCEVLPGPPVCGDGICASLQGESHLNCPEDCDPPVVDCPNGSCDHGETFETCPEDCPVAPTTRPELPADPEIWDSKFTELAARCAVLSNMVSSKEDSIKHFPDNYWQYPPTATSETVVDAALISREYSEGRCIIALRGTNPGSWDDWKQLLNPRYRWMEDEDGQRCRVREGWAQAFSGENSSGELIDGHYGRQLKQRIGNCVSDGLKLVFTGHSQGGALALVGHLTHNKHKPISITFAAPPTFVNEVYGSGEDPCPAIHNDQIYRFINTEHDELALNYDLIPFIGEAVEQILSIALPLQEQVFKAIFGFSPSTLGQTIEAIRLLIGDHKGPVALLNPEVDHSIKVYRKQDEVGEPELYMFDVLDIGLHNWMEDYMSAHFMTTYKAKVNHLNAIDPATIMTRGFRSDSQCNYQKECHTAICEAPSKKKCLRLLADNTYDCDAHEDCVSERCNKNLFSQEICEEKLDNGESCLINGDADCKSDFCAFFPHGFFCSAKIENGWPCSRNHRCKSGRCDNLFCKAIIPKGSAEDCDDDTDCWSGRCKDTHSIKYKDYCADKEFPGGLCERDAECVDGAICDENGICKKKLAEGEHCEAHADCATGRCDFPAKKTCLLVAP